MWKVKFVSRKRNYRAREAKRHFKRLKRWSEGKDRLKEVRAQRGSKCVEERVMVLYEESRFRKTILASEDLE